MTYASISDATNSKLGPMIHGWSLPAGREFSCPGESHLCRVRCYAKAGFFWMPNVKRCHINNFAFSRTDEFADWMLANIRHKFIRAMRVHVSGDFYDLTYVEKWQRIVTAAKNATFFAYTRSWRQDEMLPDLIRLSQLPNMQLWWSIDRETGPAPIVRGVRRAYMAIDDVDAELAPNDCDLVFRDQRGTVMKKANGVQVCPVEDGVKRQVKITCSSCGICWSRNMVPAWERELKLFMGEEPEELLAPEVV